MTFLLLFFASLSAHAEPKCVPQYSTKELCVLTSADMSRVARSPEVLLAAKVVALKMKPYFPPNDPRMYLIMGYRSAAQQERIRRTGVRAGPASGRFVSAHIYGVALDVQIQSKRQLGKEMCAALNQIIPMLKNKGGVIMEGSGGGSTNGHIDDNWGARFSMEKTGEHKSLNYTGGECTENYGVTGPSAALYQNMAKITVDSLGEVKTAEDSAVPTAPTEQGGEGENHEAAPPAQEEQSVKVAPVDTNRQPSSWAKYH